MMKLNLMEIELEGFLSKLWSTKTYMLKKYKRFMLGGRVNFAISKIL